MAPDIEQNYFPIGDEECQSDAVTVGETYCVAAGEFAGKRMKFKVGLERVLLQIGDYLGEAGLQVGMLPEEPTGLAQELLWHGEDEHAYASSVSSAFNRSSAVVNFCTRPSFSSFNDALIRARYASFASAINS